jgi:hypothetical protein
MRRASGAVARSLARRGVGVGVGVAARASQRALGAPPLASSFAQQNAGFPAPATPSRLSPPAAAPSRAPRGFASTPAKTASAATDASSSSITADDIEMKGVQMRGRPMYLDMQSTTPVDPRVLDAMMPYLVEQYGNPHSRTHMYGWEAEDAIEAARADVAKAIGANAKEIIFTSGATESNNMAIKARSVHWSPYDPVRAVNAVP